MFGIITEPSIEKIPVLADGGIANLANMTFISEIGFNLITLMVNEPLFSCNATTISTEVAIHVDNTMTGNNNGNLISSICISDGSTGRRLPY